MEANWYNSHSSRRYPLDDNATGTDDSGARLSDDIIDDLALSWPLNLGQFAFLAGLTVTEKLVTAVIVSSNSPTTATDPVTLASVSLIKPVDRHVHYDLVPAVAGVGGFIAFGDITEVQALRFSSPAQGLLMPKIARPFNKLPVPEMKKLGRRDALTGVVKIIGGTDVLVEKDTVSIDGGSPREAVVIRLDKANLASNTLARYIGPCGKRPESRNCTKEGVEFINGVAPDCAGNINIVFENLTDAPYADSVSDSATGVAGVTLDQDLNLADACLEAVPDRFRGRDLCEGSASSSSSSSSAGGQ